VDAAGNCGTFALVTVPRDPRLRPYRAALWIVYFAIVLVGIGLMALSVGRSLRTPSRPPRVSGPLPTRAALRVCLDDLELLFREQRQRPWALAAPLQAQDPAASWYVWAREWEARLDDLSDRCRLDESGGEDAAARGELAAARDALLSLHKAYAAYVDRFELEQRELARSTADSLARARSRIERGR